MEVVENPVPSGPPVPIRAIEEGPRSPDGVREALSETADLSAKFDALTAFMLDAHAPECQPNTERPWLLRRGSSCPARAEPWEALG